MNKQLAQNEESLRADKDYLIFLENVKNLLKNAQIRTANMVNIEVLQFYWRLGKDILEIQANKQHWGSKFLDQLSHDLQIGNPGMSGFSRRSLEYMRLLVVVYPEKDQRIDSH